MCNHLTHNELKHKSEKHCNYTRSTQDVSDDKDTRGKTTTKMSSQPFTKHDVTLENDDKLDLADG